MALSENRPRFAFAGLWTRWRGVRGPKSAPVEGEHELFGFLTTEANAIVAPTYPNNLHAMCSVTRGGSHPDPEPLERERHVVELVLSSLFAFGYCNLYECL